MFQRHKWDQTQCSYCGEKGRQFVCWECLESTMEEMNERIDTLQKELEVQRIVIDTLLKVNGLKLRKVAAK